MFSISKWDYIWFPVLSVYAYFFKSTPFNKAVLCFGATALAVTSSILNYDKLFTEPFKEGIMTEVVQSYAGNYLLTDFIAMCARRYYIKEPLRKDIVFHHTFFYLITVLFKTSNIQIFTIVAEVLSIWPLFTNDIKTITYLRIFSIFPIRSLIWYYIYSVRNFPLEEYHMRIIINYFIYAVVPLDLYWLYTNIKILYKLKREEKQTTLIKND